MRFFLKGTVSKIKHIIFFQQFVQAMITLQHLIPHVDLEEVVIMVFAHVQEVGQVKIA